MVERGVKPVSINTYLRCIRAYWKWQNKKLKIPKLKEEQKILQTLSANDISSLVRYKAVGTNLLRAHMVTLLICDTGLRISEVLALKKEDIDFDTLVMKTVGKGGKHRLVPFSLELRKSLWKFANKISAPKLYIFGTKNNSKVSVRNIERDFNVLGKRIGLSSIRFSPHTLRHSFAVNYLRSGGNLEYLRRILGHSSLTTTQKYLKSLGVEDLRAVHDGLSLLNHGH